MRADYLALKMEIERLRTTGAARHAFGATAHRFELKPVLAERNVSTFEEKHHVQMPRDYRDFIRQLGNGGAGPFYGLFALGMMDHGFGEATWSENDGFVGILREPFPHTDAWNSTFDRDARGPDDDEYATAADAYWSPALVNGAIPICHAGCALRYWLVISGPLAGDVWYDRRAEWRGLEPVLIDGKRASFLDWYRDWLGHLS